MCIALWSLEHPGYALVLGANRDEFLNRPTETAHWHAFGSSGDLVLSGLDVRAGGTWLGINKSGRIALLTNIREDPKQYSTSRGQLASKFLMTDVTLSMESHLNELVNQQETYAGFNLLLLDPIASEHGLSYDAELVSNMGGGGRIMHRRLSTKERQCDGLSNGVDGHGGEVWPKVLAGKQDLQSILEQDITRTEADQDANLVNSMFQILAQEHGDPLTQREDLRKTIQVPLISVQTVPNLNGTIPATVPPSHSPTSWYGTRLATVILVRRDGKVLFVERDIYKLGQDGAPYAAFLDDAQIRQFQEGHESTDRCFRFSLSDEKT